MNFFERMAMHEELVKLRRKVMHIDENVDCGPMDSKSSMTEEVEKDEEKKSESKPPWMKEEFAKSSAKSSSGY